MNNAREVVPIIRPDYPEPLWIQAATLIRDQISHFFQHYKDLEPNKWVRVLGWGGPDEAGRLINEAIDRVRLKIPASRRSSSTMAAATASGPPSSTKK